MLTVMGPTTSHTLRANDKSKISSLRPNDDDASARASLIEALSDLHDLLEEYAPFWYTEEHHRKAESALHRDKDY